MQINVRQLGVRTGQLVHVRRVRHIIVKEG